MKKQYKITFRIRKGFQDTMFGEPEVVEQGEFKELFQLKQFSTFKDDAYLVVEIEEIPQPEAVEVE